MKSKYQKLQSKLQSAAILTIKDADIMTEKGRKDIAEWLKQQAKNLIKYGKDYDKRFRARYLHKKRK